MKYYRKTKVFHEGTENEYVFLLGYTADDLPLNTPIYGFAYDINDDTERRRLNCLPTLGEIVIIRGGCRGKFIPYKKGTQEKRNSGSVDFNSRCYADTYEEAVEMYNELVQSRINNLKRMIREAENDKVI